MSLETLVSYLVLKKGSINGNKNICIFWTQKESLLL